jgi:hypothetical protein
VHGKASVETEWPGAGRALMAELAGVPGRLCLICGNDGTALGERLAADIGLKLGSVGAIFANLEEPPETGRLPSLLAGYDVLIDWEVVFWPDLAVSPVGLLRLLARRQPLVAIWPGEITGGRAIYSRPGRPDHLEASLSDVIVLRPCPTRFPDEIPYSMERIVP